MAFELSNISKQTKVLDKKHVSDVSFLKKEISFLNKPFSNKVKEHFYTELSVLLKAGITIKDALELIKETQKKPVNKEVLQRIYDNIISGASLSDALQQQKFFTKYEYYSLKIGEETGSTSKISEQLAQFFVRKNEQRRNLISALSYPIIIFSTATLVVIFMLQFVVPMFEDIFKQQNVELPTLTKFIINISSFIKSYGGYLIVLCITLLVLRVFLIKKQWFNKFKDQFVLKIPFIGSFIKAIYLAQFTQAVALLTSSKVPMINSIQLVRQMINFYPLQKVLSTIESSILKGDSLSDSMKKHKLFDNKMIALVKVAEETNETEFVFERLNHQYTIKIQQQSKLLSTIMEPLIIVFVGLLVGVILISMYLPMFKLSSVLG